MNDKPKVLVVEDTPSMQDIARIYLEPHATVIIAGSINTARRMLGSESDISFVILDGYVPLFDNEKPGNSTTLVLAQEIKNRYKIPMYSASSDEELNKKLADAGCVHTNKQTAYSEVRKSILAIKV